jgi:hypothetical protein
MAPLGLLAIEGNYKNGRARIYLVDDGVSVTPVATDFDSASGEDPGAIGGGKVIV